MEAAIRWSPHSTPHDSRFLIIDVASNRLRLCRIDSFSKNKVNYSQLCIRDKLPNYTAFDWSKKEPSLVGIGSASGEALLVQLDPDRPDSDFVHTFPIKHQRKCNSIAFSNKNLLATGLDRVRNDVCLNIYDLNDPRFTSKDEPYKKLASSEAISSIKFFSGQPDTLIAGVSRQSVRIYDLRDPSTSGIAQFQTRQVHNLAIDPLDENYFLSAGTAGEPVVTVWDTRMVKQRISSNDTANNGSVLQFQPVVENSPAATIWSLRYSGTKRGTFGVLANTGEFKIIEMAQHSHQLSQAPDTPFARTWASNHYTRATHHLRYPSHNKEYCSEEKDRLVAYDFMTVGNPLNGQCALALHSNREVEVLKVPAPAPRINVTALEEIYKDRTCIARPSPAQGTVAEDLISIQNKALVEKYSLEPSTATDFVASTEKLDLNNSQRNLSLLSGTHASQQMHEDILSVGYPAVKIPLDDYLAVLQTAKRRCEEGYSLATAQNKSIVANDPWLVDLWSFIARMDAHAQDDGMVGNGLDLKYLGVNAIWSNELTMYDERLIDPDAKTSQDMFRDAVREIADMKELPAFEGVTTQYPENRQLCLSLCGWPLDKEGVRANADALSDAGETYKAIVLAVFQGHNDIALSLLRANLAAKKLPPELIGLGAVISCASPSADISSPQREACAWMADMTSDPYLKSLLTYFTTSSWPTVASMRQLSLPDRVAIAMKYLPDTALTSFLSTITAITTTTGFLPALLLTGLTPPALSLLESHISRFPTASSLQTAVLLLSRACPLYVRDPRWPLWKDAYLSLQQSWRAFLPRARYIREHNAFSVTREGRSVGRTGQPGLAIRCMQCHVNLALRGEGGGRRLVAVGGQGGMSGRGGLGGSKGNVGRGRSPALSCPSCRAQMPRCGLCMLWLGAPDPYVSLPGAGTATSGAGSRNAAPGPGRNPGPSNLGPAKSGPMAPPTMKQGAVETFRGEPLEARLMVFCMTCTHGFHGHHARDWFRRHKTCPVPDCGCMCGLLK